MVRVPPLTATSREKVRRHCRTGADPGAHALRTGTYLDRAAPAPVRLASPQAASGTQALVGGGCGPFELVQALDARETSALHPRAVKREPVAVVARLGLEVAQPREVAPFVCVCVTDGASKDTAVTQSG